MSEYAAHSDLAPKGDTRPPARGVEPGSNLGWEPVSRTLGRIVNEDALWGWQPEMALGVPVLDHQHQRIVQQVAELRRAVAQHDPETLGYLLEHLGHLVKEHFATEEKLMEIGYYPFLEEHRRSHRRLMEHLLAFQRRHLEGAEIGRELLNELRVFLDTHVRHEDPLFVPYVLSIAKQSWLARLCDVLFPVRPAES